MDLRLVPPALAAWACAAWLVGVAAPTAVLVAVSTVVLAGLAAHRWSRVALVLVAVAAVSTSTAWRLADTTASPLLAAAESGRTLDLRVQVVQDARTYGSHGTTASVATVLVLRADVDGRRIAVRDRATAFLDGEHPDLVVGRRLTVTARASPADDSRDTVVLDVERRSAVEGAAWWWSGSERVREGVRRSVAHTGEGPSALVPALVAGDDGGLSEQVEEEFRRTGLTHLLAVSGTNLTIVLAMVLAVARGCRAPRRLVVPLGLLSVVAFVLLARPEPSVVRAAAMGVVGLAALGLGSRGGVRALAVAVVALLFLDPWLSRALGFVLSVCATAGILVLAPPFVRALERWLPRWAAVAVAVPLAAQAACTPAIAAISGEVSLVAVLANLLAAPAVAPATVAGLLGGLLALVWVPLGAVIGTVAGACAAWILAVAHHTASFAGASVGWSLPWWVLVPVTPAVLWLLWRASRHPAVLVGLCLGLVVAMWRPPSPGWPPPGWVMVACDVGQGDATVLRSGPGEAVVVDTGIDPAAVDRCLRSLGVERVRALVLTHADADHVDGWPGVVAGRDVDAVLVGREGVDVPGVPRRTVVAGEHLRLGGVRAEVLWPAAAPVGSREPESEDRNGLSVVLRVEVGGATALLTGDLGESEQQRLLATGAVVGADVLKVSHHGSADTSERFVRTVGARVATISVGADNTYGHPAPSAVRMLRDAGTASWRTDFDGDVAVVVRDGRLGVVTRR